MSANEDARPTSFPQDLASCHAMLEGVFQSLAEKDQRIGQLEELVEALIRERYARKSERYDPNQLALFQLKTEDDGDVAEPPEAEDAAPHVTSIPAETGPDDEPVDAAIDEDLATDEAGAGTGVVHATESAENQDSADADIDEKDRAEVADLPATR